MTSSDINDLIRMLARLPGVGPRSARRLALTLLTDRENLMKPLMMQMDKTYGQVMTCTTCGNLDSSNPCHICADTRRNVARLALAVDAVLCAPAGVSDKNPRFQAVARGTAGLPPLDVVLWVGDNVQDFPGVQQRTLRSAGDAAYAPFGDRWILLPNPLYGSWDRIPYPTP